MKTLKANDYWSNTMTDQRNVIQKEWVESLPNQGMKLLTIGFEGEVFWGEWATSPGASEWRVFEAPPHRLICELVRTQGVQR